MRVSWDEGRSINVGSGDDGNNQRISQQPVRTRVSEFLLILEKKMMIKHQKCPEMGSKPQVYMPKKNTKK